MNIQRCEWVGKHPLYLKYHDEEWGVPVHTDEKLFEMLILEGAQAGLNWLTILRKRENYHRAFEGFDPARIALYGDEEIDRLLADAGIIRNRLKIAAAIQNARAFLKVKEEYGTFDRYIWQFVGHRPIEHNIVIPKDIPTKTAESEAMSKDLLKRGFKFVGPTICYAFMQAVGMVNDHQQHCFRFEEIPLCNA